MLNNNVLSSVNTYIQNALNANMLYVDFGTGTTPVTSSDSVMEASVVRNPRQQITIMANDVIVSGFLGSGQANGSSITEIGVFDASTSGNMQEHALITAIAKTSGKEIWVDIRTHIGITNT